MDNQIQILLNIPPETFLENIDLLISLVEQQDSEIAIRTSFKTTYLNTDLFITIIVLVAGILIGMLMLTNIRTRQKREAESFLESVLNTSLNGIITLQAIRQKGVIVDFKVTFVNKAILNFLGMTREHIMGKTVLEINPLVKEEGIFQKYIEVADTGIPMKTERRVENSCFIVLLAKINDGLTCSYYNITDLKNTERELNVKLRELEEKNIELEQLAYVTSHDLQEPLRKINMFADVLMTADVDAEKKTHLQSITRSVARMKTLINKLQEYSKLNRNSLLFLRVNLNEIVHELTTIYEDALREKGIIVTRQELPVIEGIPLQLYTLFDNLLNNAIKYSKPTTSSFIDISVRKFKHDQSKRNVHLNRTLPYIEIIFRDNGVGFEQSDARKIFMIFQKLEIPRTMDEVGIGLALCQKIVRCHQGDIYAVSRPDEGSEFHIILPVNQERENA